MRWPRMVKARQEFPRPAVRDLEGEIRREFSKLGLAGKIPPRGRVAITAGSRGIKDLPRILRAVVEEVRRAGGEPFVVAAMGSHGRGTAEGQRAILQSLGISGDTVAAPVCCDTEVAVVGVTVDGLPVYLDAAACRADGIVVVNRVKPHTAYRGEIESGLCKMLAVGLGKAKGAESVHRLGPGQMARVIPEMARIILAGGKVLAGLAIVENAYEETARVEGVEPEAFLERERELLREARALMPGLPVDSLDLLIVEVMGKNISGTGMDSNVIGRWGLEGVPEPDRPRIRRIAVLDLAPESHGNANGIGLADFTTRRLVEKIDFQATYLNCLTSGFVRRAMIPMTFPTDRKAIAAALRSLHQEDPSRTRVIRIKNTLHLGELDISEALVEEVGQLSHVRLLGEPRAMSFDSQGRLL